MASKEQLKLFYEVEKEKIFESALSASKTRNEALVNYFTGQFTELLTIMLEFEVFGVVIYCKEKDYFKDNLIKKVEDYRNGYS